MCAANASYYPLLLRPFGDWRNIVRDRAFLICFLATVTFFTVSSPLILAAERPNVIFIMADDLGYGDLGCYGQQVIHTPRLDQMAEEGLRFTQFYAGCPVCAPSRSVLMTGLHTGHTHVRGNASGDTLIQSLRDQDVTVAEVLKSVGYRTGLIGKWGLGEVDQPGFPLRQGFDSFFGYLNQVHAHNYYPEFLYRNDQRVQLRNEVQKPEGRDATFLGGSATKRVDYSHDLFANEALQFVEQNAENPFFLYLALTIPHANNEASRMIGDGTEVPTYGIYANEDWPKQDKGQAAMITRMDGDIGRLLDLLKNLGIDDKTIVFFTSDNGPHDEAQHDLTRFNPSGPLRGIKRALTEGGVRVPMIVRWPTQVHPGVSDHIGYFADIMPTLADLAGAKAIDNTDGISFLPTLMGTDSQDQHEYLYWEFYEQGSRQSVRFGDWVAIRQPMLTGGVELYNVSEDIGERIDQAGQQAELVQRATEYMNQAHVHHPNWEPRGTPPAKR
ncbi:MAG: arylsulfatase [Planctomycetales bacterium]|nr:arylsulfatase [Planctomycetales bacterium]